MTYTQNKQSLKELTKEELCKWISSVYSPTHHLTVRLPEHKRSDNLDKSTIIFKYIMVRFQKILVKNNWHKKHLKFITIAEPHANDDWHFHTLFNSEVFNTYRLQDALDSITKQLKLPKDCLYLTEIIDNPEFLPEYITKEIIVRYYGHFDSSVLILSHNLFGLPDEAKDFNYAYSTSNHLMHTANR